ncbi:MAG TPA: glycosyltransferase, partial [Nitrolancea sp.]|nr:glycosyltransferase [Nitrolancea sp.]
MRNAPKRYLHVIQRYFPFRGGSERYFQAFSERFVARGDRVQIVTSDAWDLEYFWNAKRKRVGETCGELNGVEVIRVPVKHLPAASLTHRGIRRLMAESCRLPFPGHGALLGIGSRFGPWLPSLDARLAEMNRPDLVNSANIAFESMIAAAAKVAHRFNVPHVVTPFLHFGEADDPKVRRYYTMPHQLDLLR